jgi:heme/copper-type cytochrome/quinol oxidase subunit 2
MIAENLLVFAIVVFLLMFTGIALTIWEFRRDEKKQQQQRALEEQKSKK